MNKAAIIGSGIYLPEKIKTNHELEKKLFLESGFILKSTGIQERRWCNDNETLEFMASEASVNAVKNAGIGKIERIILSRDVILTARAKSIGLPIIERLREEGIDVSGCYSIDVMNYCPGAIHSANIAKLMVDAEEAQSILVVASTRYADMVDLSPEFNESYPSEVFKYSIEQKRGNFQHPNLNAFLWGNGAGALVVGKSRNKGQVMSYHAEGSKHIPYDSFGIGEDSKGHGFACLDGTAIYKFAVKEVPEFIAKCLEKWNVKLEQIASFIPHQPNPRILKALIKKYPELEDKIEITCDKLGNMIGASIPITYHLAKEQGRIKPGDYVFMCSFGDSYLTAAGLLFRQE